MVEELTISSIICENSNLTALARSGVLLLNTSLTVSPHKAGSHSNRGWETFTDKVIDLVDRYGGHKPEGDAPSPDEGAEEMGRGVVVLAWGAWAAKRVAKMDKVRHVRAVQTTRFPVAGLLTSSCSPTEKALDSDQRCAFPTGLNQQLQ